MTVDVIVPFAGTCEHRRRAWEWVASQYRAAGLNVIEGHADPDRWVKANAVRDALERSSAEIVVVADADVWCDQLGRAIEAVDDGAAWAIPHWNVIRLTEAGTTRLIVGDRDGAEIEEKHTGAPAGALVVMRRETYDRVPLDPRFVGWFGEDRAWAYGLRTLAGEVARFEAPLWHLWHPPQPRRSRRRGSEANQLLCGRYHEALFDPDRMRALIDEARWNRGDRGLLHDGGHDHHARADI